MSTGRAARHSFRPGLCLVWAALAACSGGAVHPPTPPPIAQATPPAPPASSQAPVDLAPIAGRVNVVPSGPRQLPTVILQASRGLLLVSDTPGSSAALVRRIDASGVVGPPIALPGEHVAEVLTPSNDRFTLVTTSGAALCLATYREGSAAAEARGCASVAPDAVAAVGDRVALIETREVQPAKPKAAPPPKKASAKKPPAKKPSAKKRPAKKTTKKRPAKRAASTAPRQAPKLDVLIRWASREGQVDAQAQPIGLRFQRALAGMTILGAAGREDGLDLVWYESAPAKRNDNGRLGRARLVAARVDADGKLVESSRRTLYEGPLDYAGLGDHRDARLITTVAGTILVERDKGSCAALRVGSGSGSLPASEPLCLLDPARLAGGVAPSPSELAALGLIAGERPSRAPGQPESDLGRVGWAGDRGYYLQGGTLRSASRGDGVAREEPKLMEAARARVAWGGVSVDGVGLAMVDSALYRLGAGGEVAPLPLGPLAHVDALLRSDEAGAGAELARVGDAWLIARGGDVLRLAPNPAPLDGLRGRAYPDSTAIVGGAARGLFIELAGAWLSATPLTASGLAAGASPSRAPSPVRPGFRAVARRGGGAVIAGVSADSPSGVVALAVDAEGRVGHAFQTSLSVEPGALGVSLVALPDGGALLSSPSRAEVVWLDDDGHQHAKAPWPNGAVEASCVDGLPARLDLPSPEPGKFVRIAELGHPGTCIIGEPSWSADGSLRWLGSRAAGFDALVEVGHALVGGDSGTMPRTAAAAAPVEPPVAPPVAVAAPPAPACPPDMVSIAGAYCVDRFEGMLVDVGSGARVSPDYPTTPGLFDYALSGWATERERAGDVRAHALPLPLPPTLTAPSPKVVARMGVRPNGYLSGDVAEAACAATGKRLCSLDEFVRACRGEQDTDFPYGPDYRYGVCNVDRSEHPASTLHGNASLGHLDPRLGHVVASDGPLLRVTGGSPACRSEWGSDAVYDMVGNIDEWVTEPDGFAGGFYSRSARNGCDALVTSHPKRYLDYSLGVRCCKDAEAEP